MTEVRQYVERIFVCANNGIELNNKIAQVKKAFVDKGLKVDVGYFSIMSIPTKYNYCSASVMGYKSWKQGDEEYRKAFEDIKI